MSVDDDKRHGPYCRPYLLSRLEFNTANSRGFQRRLRFHRDGLQIFHSMVGRASRGILPNRAAITYAAGLSVEKLEDAFAQQGSSTSRMQIRANAVSS